MSRIFSICLVALAIAAMPMDSAFAASKKKKNSGWSGRSAYTSEQREKFFKEAMRRCKARYGNGQVERVEVNYTNGRITCWIR